MDPLFGAQRIVVWTMGPLVIGAVRCGLDKGSIAQSAMGCGLDTWIHWRSVQRVAVWAVDPLFVCVAILTATAFLAGWFNDRCELVRPGLTEPAPFFRRVHEMREFSADSLV